MKQFIFIFIVLAAVSCNTSKKEAPQMQGAYFMTSQIIDNGKSQQKLTDLKQLKIYTDSFMMYTQVNPSDSVSAFGVGYYTSGDGAVTENDIYAARDSIIDTNPGTYTLKINKTPDGYEQIIPEILIDSVKSRLTEEYQSTGKDLKTPLDGVWKETEYYIIKGNDTTRQKRTQYKAFYAGYFMYGHNYVDSSGKNFTGIGFGTFTMDGDNKINETDLNSTYSIAVGQTFPIDIELNGSEKYKQTIVNADGTKSVEFYERLKK